MTFLGCLAFFFLNFERSTLKFFYNVGDVYFFDLMLKLNSFQH